MNFDGYYIMQKLVEYLDIFYEITYFEMGALHSDVHADQPA